jgi:hypothetical protein
MVANHQGGEHQERIIESRHPLTYGLTNTTGSMTGGRNEKRLSG